MTSPFIVGVDGFGEQTIWTRIDGQWLEVLKKSDVRVPTRDVWPEIVALLTQEAP